MNNEQQQIIDEAYEDYESRQINMFIPIWSQEEFINKCKTDPEFSDKWGLKIEERELNHDERINLCLQLRPETKFAAHYETNETLMNDWNIPTRLITIRYNDKTIESYEYRQ